MGMSQRLSRGTMQWNRRVSYQQKLSSSFHSPVMSFPVSRVQPCMAKDGVWGQNDVLSERKPRVASGYSVFGPRVGSLDWGIGARVLGKA
jgi:hypothetical protein